MLQPAPVDWTQLETQLDQILAERAVAGPHQHRGQVETGGELWALSLQQELAHLGSEGDKRRARAYFHTVAAKARQVQLPACTLWLRLRRTPCDQGD